MTEISIKKGLDIPIKGKPCINLRDLPNVASLPLLPTPAQLALNLSLFEHEKLRLLVQPGDVVKIGDPLLEDKSSPGRMFVSPASGAINEIRRGHKRRIMDIVIDVAAEEQYAKSSLPTTTREELIAALKQGGLFSRIRSRPFNLLANPERIPRSIFVKALESAPFVPPAELQVIGHEKAFQIGLSALSMLTDGKVHLVHHRDTVMKAFSEAQDVETHPASGPHPISNQSLHIQRIDPIVSAQDVVWTLSAHDVVAIGHYLLTGHYFIERVVSIAGPGILPDRVGFVRAREGFPINGFLSGKLPKNAVRLVSGDPLTGRQVHAEGFLGFSDYVFSAVPEHESREFLHFFRLGKDKYSFSRAYLSGHLDNTNRHYDFDTNQHGERRAFIDSSLYDKVMPLKISTIHLVKAVMAEDFDLAEVLGLLEVDPEDFALPAFVDMSKIPMIDIMREGLRRYAQEVLQ